MNEPNLTMAEYIQLEEEKACRRGQEYNWETATYGKIWYDEDVHYLGSFEKEFPAIVYNDALTSEPEVSFDFKNEYPAIVYNNTLTSEPEVSIDFENEFPAIVYNDALITKPEILVEPTEPSEEVNNVGGVFINLEISKCWGLEISRWLFNTLFAQTLKMENHPEQNIKGVSSF
nr:hypothetical protein [Tanacetum cinerariifolium]